MNKIIFFRTILLLLISFNTYAQDNSIIIDSIKYNSLEKGNYLFSIGANVGTTTFKNEDELIYFILNEKESKFNIKLGFGYFIKDYTPIGVGFRYKYYDSKLEYETVVGDTIQYNERENHYISNIFYGISKPIFESKRVFFISDPSLLFGYRDLKSERTLEEITEYTKSNTHDITLGLNVGLMVFLWHDMSAQMVFGPVGVGYQWVNFFLDDEPIGTTSDFFIRMTPDLLNLSFSISKYF